MTDTLDRLLAGIASDLNVFDDSINTVTDPVDGVFLLAALRDMKQDLARVYEATEKHLLSLMGDKKMEVDGIGLVEVKRRTKRTQWRHDELWPVVVARALDERLLDEETGEYESAAEVVSRVLRDCMSPSWKVTGLRARGIQPDEFCTEEQEGYSVVLPSRGAA